MKRFPYFLCIIMLACHSTNKTGELIGVPKDASLENTQWAMTELDGNPVAIGRIRFNNDKSLIEAFAGCNVISGAYSLQGKNLSIKPETGDLVCLNMEVEKQFISAISSVTKYELKSNNLYLRNTKKVVAVFKVYHPTTH